MLEQGSDDVRVSFEAGMEQRCPRTILRGGKEKNRNKVRENGRRGRLIKRKIEIKFVRMGEKGRLVNRKEKKCLRQYYCWLEHEELVFLTTHLPLD